MAFIFKIGTKIPLTAAVPFLAFLILAVLAVRENWKASVAAERMDSNGTLYRFVSS